MGRREELPAERSHRLRPKRPLLTERQWDILYAWVEGLATKAAADRRGIHRRSYYQAQKALFAKLNAKTPAQAVFMAIRAGLIDPETYELDDE
jgi:DNA-binding CsgD family transcriptional regulator